MHARRFLFALLGSGLLVVPLIGASTTAQSTSPNYKIEESFFGSGSELDATSPNYRAKQSAGELTVGNSGSNNYQMQSGFNTTDQPLLEFAVNGGVYDLGILDAASTGSAVASFAVRNYLSGGYVVILSGSTPSTGSGAGYTLPGLTTPTGSTPGSEQFGVNLAANTNPPVGSAPSQVPDPSFGYGSGTPDYASANLFKFVNGDTIAFSNQSSGQTNYALSIIANVAASTPAGQYGGAFNLQIIPSF